MEKNEDKKRNSIDFSIKATWLAISKMYNTLGADYGVTHSSGFVLLNIDREKGTPATKIAPLLGMEARSLTRMLKNLEEQGLIKRNSDKKDRRKVIIQLTDAGKIKREMSRQTVKAFHKTLEKNIPEDKLRSFFEVINSIQKTIDHSTEKILEEVQKQMAEIGVYPKDQSVS